MYLLIDLKIAGIFEIPIKFLCNNVLYIFPVKIRETNGLFFLLSIVWWFFFRMPMSIYRRFKTFGFLLESAGGYICYFFRYEWNIGYTEIYLCFTWNIDWLVVGCFTPSSKWFINVQDKNKLAIIAIGIYFYKRGHLGWWSLKFGPSFFEKLSK